MEGRKGWIAEVMRNTEEIESRTICPNIKANDEPRILVTRD